MTREHIAAIVVTRALQRAGASPDLVQRLALGQDRSNQKLNAIVPTFERTGKASVVYWLNHSVKGLEVAPGELREVVTWKDLVDKVTSKLAGAVLLFRCTDTHEVHFYTEWGSGTCRIDGTPVEHVA